MPPKGKGKRKAKDDTPPPSSSASDDDEPKQAKPKKAKKVKAPVQPLDPDLPTNKEFPKSLTFEAKKPGHVRLSTWWGPARSLSVQSRELN